MKESTKEWLGLRPADLAIYLAFIFLVPVYYFSNFAVDVFFVILGGLCCLISCWLGMTPNPDLGTINNSIKLAAYPACTLVFVYVVYLNFTSA
jgi:hypothetical protein